MRTDSPATWFRLYAEFATDPKVQMLSEIDQRRFLMLCCLRCCNGAVTLLETEIAFQLRISDEDWQTTKNVLYKKGLIDFDNKPVKWESRQFDSDTSNARVAKHRALQKEKRPKKGNGSVTLLKHKSNAPETETETETETDTEKNKDTGAAAIADATEPVKTVSVKALIAEGIDKQKANDWLILRKAKRLPLTVSAWADTKAEGEKVGLTPADTVAHAVNSNWAGFKASWYAKDHGTSAHSGGVLAGAI